MINSVHEWNIELHKITSTSHFTCTTIRSNKNKSPIPMSIYSIMAPQTWSNSYDNWNNLLQSSSKPNIAIIYDHHPCNLLPPISSNLTTQNLHFIFCLFVLWSPMIFPLIIVPKTILFITMPFVNRISPVFFCCCCCVDVWWQLLVMKHWVLLTYQVAKHTPCALRATLIP